MKKSEMLALLLLAVNLLDIVTHHDENGFKISSELGDFLGTQVSDLKETLGLGSVVDAKMAEINMAVWAELTAELENAGVSDMTGDMF
jgi:hypothetical protein